MFISGGENVYPAEIVDALVRVPGVADALRVRSARRALGRRPAAVVELTPDAPLISTRALREALSQRLSKLYVPEQISIVDELPRSASVRSTAPLARRCSARTSTFGAWCFTTAPAVFQAFQNAEGDADLPRYGHCRGDRPQGPRRVRGVHGFRYRLVSPEILGGDLRVLRETLAPRVIAGTYLHPREVAADLFSLEGAGAFPMAVSALEMACWDLYGKVTEKPLWKLLGEEFDRMTRSATAFEGEDVAVGSACPGDRRGATRKVYSGAVVGLGTPPNGGRGARVRGRGLPAH